MHFIELNLHSTEEGNNKFIELHICSSNLNIKKLLQWTTFLLPPIFFFLENHTFKFQGVDPLNKISSKNIFKRAKHKKTSLQKNLSRFYLQFYFLLHHKPCKKIYYGLKYDQSHLYSIFVKYSAQLGCRLCWSTFNDKVHVDCLWKILLTNS